MLESAIAAIENLRREGAHVHCVTNTVAQYFTANVLLACGASPSMTYSADEAHVFTARADALLINTGTLDSDRRTAIRRCLDTAADAAKPVVVDPVKCDISDNRLAFVRELLEPGRCILKANAREAKLLADLPVLCRVTTGPVDLVEYGGASLKIRNGSPLMDRTIATGCALGALIAALNAVSREPDIAALAALVWFGVAAEIAAERVAGPGRFPAAFIDTLAAVETEILLGKARLE